MGVSGGIFIYEGPCKSLLICDNYLNMNLFCKKQQFFLSRLVIQVNLLFFNQEKLYIANNNELTIFWWKWDLPKWNWSTVLWHFKLYIVSVCIVVKISFCFNTIVIVLLNVMFSRFLKVSLSVLPLVRAFWRWRLWMQTLWDLWPTPFSRGTGIMRLGLTPAPVSCIMRSWWTATGDRLLTWSSGPQTREHCITTPLPW